MLLLLKTLLTTSQPLLKNTSRTFDDTAVGEGKLGSGVED